MVKLGLLFPGQGSQSIGMLRDVFEEFQVARTAIQEGSDGSGLDLKHLIFEGSEEELKRTEFTQPAILASSIAVFRSLQERVDLSDYDLYFAGHSLGEYSALVAAGRMELAVATRVVRERGRLMQEAVPDGKGAMVALMFAPKVAGLDIAQALVEEFGSRTGQVLVVANYNSPDQIVLAGESAAVDELVAVASSRGAKRAIKLPVSAPFHSPLMEAAARGLAQVLSGTPVLQLHQPTRLVANVDAKIHDLSSESPETLKDRLVRQSVGSVMWVQSVHRLLAEGVQLGLEVGPGSVLTGLCRRISHEGRALAVHSVNSVENLLGTKSFLEQATSARKE
jgi:[acyl-carrier-protein] S-malonyltransferase